MYQQIAANKRKSLIMMAAFVGFVAALAYLFTLFSGGDRNIFPFVLAGVVIYTIITYYAGSKMSLAVSGAQEIQKRDNPRLYRIIENLSITDGLPMPKVYIIDDPAPNAMATGRDPNHATVSVTSGLLDIMEDNELEGVIAHELGHVKNYDIRVAMLAFALVAVVSILIDIMWRMTWFRSNDDDNNNPVIMVLGIVAIILAPIVASLIQLAVSRKREYLADATGALTTRYPEGLMSALQKIKQKGSVMKRQNASTAHFFFANPLKGHSLTTLFSTHPPIDERIARLREMGDKA